MVKAHESHVWCVHVCARVLGVEEGHARSLSDLLKSALSHPSGSLLVCLLSYDLPSGLNDANKIYIISMF